MRFVAPSAFLFASALFSAAADARFLQRDPVGYADQINLYAYVGNDPLNQVDPTGMDGQLYWSAPDKVTYTVPFYVDTSTGGQPGFTVAGVQAQISRDFSKTVQLNGVNVQVTAQAVSVAKPGPGVNTIHVYPTTQGVTQSSRAETNRIGGNDIKVGNSNNAVSISHELGGHSGGAGDQYQGGVDVNGHTLTADVPGVPNRMHDRGPGGANDQTMREILTAKTNTNTCAKNVQATNGGC